MSADKLLAGLSRVKKTGTDQWVAACPICQSRKGRPIAVRVLPDSRILLHAFCGCDTAAVLNDIGLQFSDLFPERPGEFKPERRPFDGVQVVHAIAHEVMVVTIIAYDMATAGSADDEQRERLMQAVQRLNNVLDAIGEGPVSQEILRIRRAGA